MLYSGIEVNETRLLASNIIFTFILVLTIVLAVIALLVFYDKDILKNRERMRTLKDKATKDPVAEKRLKRMARKFKRKRKDNLFSKVLTVSMATILIFINLLVAVIPGWTDYIEKDYVVYDGTLSVQKYLRTSTIILEDGTVLTGSLGLEEGQYNKRIVYSKRTEIALWIDN